MHSHTSIFKSNTYILHPFPHTIVSILYLGAVCRGYFYVVGGYNGRACISDCRRASVPLNSFRGSFVLSSDMLAPGPIGLSKLNDRVDACMEKFSKTRVGWLSRNEIREMIREITTMTVADQTNQSITTTTNNANKSGSSTGNNSNSGAPEERYPFDTSLMPQVLANGFQRAHVLQVLEMLHNRGEKFDLGKLFNVLLDTPYRPGYTVKPLPSSATASTAPTPSSNSKIAESKYVDRSPIITTQAFSPVFLCLLAFSPIHFSLINLNPGRYTHMLVTTIYFCSDTFISYYSCFLQSCL